MGYIRVCNMKSLSGNVVLFGWWCGGGSCGSGTAMNILREGGGVGTLSSFVGDFLCLFMYDTLFPEMGGKSFFEDGDMKIRLLSCGR